MKKYRPEDFWFEITTGPAGSDGRGIRYYRVTCCRCGASASHKAKTGMSDPEMRKYFLRQGWHVHRNRGGHLCADCQRKREVHIEQGPLRAEPPPPSDRLVNLKALWAQCSAEERAEFWGFLWDEYPHPIAQPEPEPEPEPEPPPRPAPEPEPRAEWQHGSHIDSMPVEAPLPEIEHPPEVIVEDDDDEPADWWKELQAKRGSR